MVINHDEHRVADLARGYIIEAIDTLVELIRLPRLSRQREQIARLRN